MTTLPTVQQDATVEFRTLLNQHGADVLGYSHLLSRVSLVYTNVANGNFVTVEEHGLENDLHVTDNDDGTLTVIVVANGNTVMYGPDGKAIARNPGQIQLELIVDHNGTPDDRSDDNVIQETVIKSSMGRTDVFCEAAVPVLTG